MNSTTQTETKAELLNLINAANAVYLAVWPLNKTTPEGRRVNELNEALREAIVHAKNSLNS